MPTTRELLQGLANEAIDAADGAFRRLPSISGNTFLSDLGQRDQRARLAGQTAQRLNELSARAKALADDNHRRAKGP